MSQQESIMIEMENGVHDISNEMYHASSGVSRSGLMELKRSPYHYWYRYMNPECEIERPTPAMKLGELVHAMVLEPKYFEERYVIPPELHQVPKVELLKDLQARLGKDEGRLEYDMQKSYKEHIIELNDQVIAVFESTTKDKEIISLSNYEESNKISNAVWSNEIANDLFLDIHAEKSIYFTHEPTGLQVKVRPDAWNGAIVTDLKTCLDATFRAFQRAAFSSGYFLQAAMIKMALKSLGIHMERFIFFCVEKKAPFPSVYYVLDDEAINYGVKQFNSLMDSFAKCLEDNNWPGYESQFLSIPNYAQYED